MQTIPMKPIVQLSVGQKISARHEIKSERVVNWKYGRECPSRFIAIPPGSVLKIFEINIVFPVWVKAYIPHSHDTAFLKISGEELAGNFLLVSP